MRGFDGLDVVRGGIEGERAVGGMLDPRTGEGTRKLNEIGSTRAAAKSGRELVRTAGIDGVDRARVDAGMSSRESSGRFTISFVVGITAPI